MRAESRCGSGSGEPGLGSGTTGTAGSTGGGTVAGLSGAPGVPGSGSTGVTGVSGTTGVGGSWGAGTSRPGIAACPGRRRAEPPDGVEIEKAIPVTYPRLRVANPENGRALVRSREPPFITDSVTSAAD